MGLTASLDMGSEKMVMALAAADASGCRLTGIKIVASQGVERGMVKDKEKARACVRGLMVELVKDRHVETLNIGLSGEVVRMSERRITVTLQKRVVEQADLYRAEQRCVDSFEGGGDELVDVIPVGYSVDRGELVSNPVGQAGRNLEVVYQVYVADTNYLNVLRHLFEGAGIDDICFFPVVRAYAEGVDAEGAERDFALVDLGAMGIHVVLFRDGMLEYEAYLPVGMHTVDLDMTVAFALSASQARKLKHEYGQALRSACKNKKLPIPDTRLTLESRDLATVVQSRVEELLEGVAWMLQSWGFDDPEDQILLTGGGSRLLDIDVLLNRISGHPVNRAVARRVQTSREEVLRTPEYLVAIGLLLCASQEPQESKGKIMGKLRGFFGI